MRADQRRVQIMRAAEQLFVNRRYHEITTDDIAAQAGVGKGTIYRYFKNKEELFHETAMHGFEELCLLLENEHHPAEQFSDRLLRASRRIVGFFTSRRRLFGLMQAEENRLAHRRGRSRKEWRRRRQRLTGILASMLSDAVEHGELRTDIPVERQANLLLGMLKTLAREKAESPDGRDPVADAVALFLHGAGA